MALEAKKRVGILGLNLGTDPAQLAEGSLTIADGIRYLESGAVHTRGGRVFAGLLFPDEGVAGAEAHAQSVPWMRAGARVRGIAPFYDQRLQTKKIPHLFTAAFATDIFTANGHGLVDGNRVTITQSGTFPIPGGFSIGLHSFVVSATTNTFKLALTVGGSAIDVTLDGYGLVQCVDDPIVLPQRLNLFYKSGGRLHINQNWDNHLDGDLVFNDPNTRAKFVPYGDKVYVVDETTFPKVIQRRPITEQVYLHPILYDVRRMGIAWPMTTLGPIVTVAAGGPDTLQAGTFRFRIQLENKNGQRSNPSITVAAPLQLSSHATTRIKVDWASLVSTFPVAPNDCKYVRICVSWLDYETTPTQIEPSAFKFWRKIEIGADVDSAGVNACYFRGQDLDALQSKPLMDDQNGALPRIKDLVVVGDVGYAIAMPDTIYRESVLTDGATRLLSGGGFQTAYLYGRWQTVKTPKIYDNTEIKEMRVDSSYLFQSEPGDLEHMETWIQVCTGAEVAVGLAPLGSSVVIFTNIGIKIWDPDQMILRTIPVNVGCMSRDCIVPVDGGILFMGSDGIPRIFNGSPILETADELLPIFARDDYEGYYRPFDKANAQEVSGTNAPRRVFVSYPVTQTATVAKPDATIDIGLSRNMMVGDSSIGGRQRWSIDSHGYDTLYWLGREGRLLAVDSAGDFYFIEEGFLDYNTALYPAPVSFCLGMPWLSGGGLMQQFYTTGLDIDTQNQTIYMDARVDGRPEDSYTYTILNQARDEVRVKFPSNFKGRYLDLRLRGEPLKRIAFYGLIDERAKRGEFS